VGGKTRVQPIHQDDVTNCLLAALRVPWTGPQTRIIAGPYPCTYADFVRAAATAAGLKPPRILAVPLWLLLAAAPLTRLPGLPRIRGDEIRRLAEDKGFDSDVLALTGRPARSLAEGLGRTFSLR
jgi:nucleoside-diphosphate-sugar epimerase